MRNRTVLPLVILLLAPAFAVPSPVAGQRPTARVTRIKGWVAVKYGKGDFQPLAKGARLKVGAVIKTGRKSRIEIRLADDSVIRLGAKTAMTLQRAMVTGEATKNVTARLWSGKAYAVVKKLSGEKSSFEIKTGTAVAGVRGTAFRINAAKDQSTIVRVYSGAVAVSNAPIYAKPGKSTKTTGSFQMPRRGVKPGGPGRVEVAGPREVTRKEWEEFVAKAMQEVRVSAAGEISKPVGFDPAEDLKDEWVAWNKAMDKELGDE